MIDIQKLSKSFGGQIIFNDVSVKINKGEHVGIVGANGIGKTTLFSMVINPSEIDKGDIIIPNNLRISYLKQYLTDDKAETSLLDYTENALPELKIVINKIKELEKDVLSTVGEEHDKLLDKIGELQFKLEALGGYELKTRAEAALTGLGFKTELLAKSISTFSGGWQMRAALARTLISDPDILLLDEPSNYLDVNAIEWLYRYLKSFQGTIMLISHDRYLLNMLTKVTLEINNGKITRYEGNYDYYHKEREQRTFTSEAEKQNLAKKKEQIEKFVERFRYKSSKASQVQSRIKMLEKMEDVETPDKINYSGILKLPPPPKSNHEIIRLEHCIFGYESGRIVLNDIDIAVNRGDKIAVVGYNGMGKTTLLKLIAGILKLKSGKRNLPSNTIIGYQAQEFGEILSPLATAYDIVKNACPDPNKVRSILGTFGFSDETVYKPCQVLSGGEKIRLLFARIFANPPNLLILDEPTTHLDIRARENLQNIIRDYEGTVCFVSHDIEFIRNTAEIIYEVKDEKITKYFGDYDYYIQKSVEKSIDKIERPETKKTPLAEDRKSIRKRNAEIRQKYSNRKKELAKIIKDSEMKLGKIESEKNELLEKLASGSSDINYQKTNWRLQDIEVEIIKLTELWENSSVELEEIDIKVQELVS